MRSRHLVKSIQRQLIEHFIAGTTARITASFYGNIRKIAAYNFHHLREIINFELEQETDAIFMAKLK